MKVLRAWLLCLLMLGLALRGAADRTHQHSMEIHSECLSASLSPPRLTPGPGAAWSLENLAGKGVWERKGNQSCCFFELLLPKASPRPEMASPEALGASSSPGGPQHGLATGLRGPACALCPAASRAHSAHDPDVNPAWYTSRRIRPVGRFGRRRAALGDVSKPGLLPQLTCFPLEGGAKTSQDG
ncbi:Prolactin-releasing peptide [Plecturocebus cupreus]